VLLLLFFSSSVATYFLIQIPAVQTWLVQRASDYLSSELNTKVTISHFNFKPFRSLLLKDLYIEDLDKDTLLFVHELQVKISRISISKRGLDISAIDLKNATIGVKRYKYPREYNFDFIARYFSPTKQDTTAAAPWDVTLKNINIENSTLHYQDLKYNDVDSGIDWEDVHLYKLNANIEDLSPISDSLTFKMNKLSFAERSGFIVDAFSTRATILPTEMRFVDSQLKTALSDLNFDFNMKFESLVDFEDFIPKVKCAGRFRDCKLGSKDLVYFAEEVKGLDKTIFFKGDVKGTIDRLKSKNIEIRYTKDTYFVGSVNLTGLPDVESMYMEIGAEDLSVKKSDIETIKAFPFATSELMVLPSNLNELGVTHFKGRFNGFYNDFVAYGNITSDLGYFTSDLNLKLGQDDNQTVYSGSVTFFNFNAGKLLLIPDLGQISAKANVKGSGISLENINVNLDGYVSKLQYMNYNYSNIALNGHLGKKLFNGDLTIKDPNLDLDFSGDIDLTGELPVYDFHTSINSIRPALLGLVNRDATSELSAEVSINMVGSTFDNAQGVIQVEDLVYTENNNTLKNTSIILESKISDKRYLSVESGIFDCKIIGQYKLSEMLNISKWVLSNYVPGGILKPITVSENQQFHLLFNAKKVNDVTAIFMPWLQISPATMLESNINSTTNDFSLLIKSKEIAINNVVMEGVNLAGTSSDKFLNLSSTIDAISVTDSLNIYDLKMSGLTNKDSSAINLKLNGNDSTSTKANVRFDVKYLNTGYSSIKLIPTTMLLNKKEWTIDPKNFAIVDQSGLLFQDFDFRSSEQEVHFGGIIASDTTTSFNVKFNEFEASQLNDILSIYNVMIGGIVNGEVEIGDVLHKPNLSSQLKVKNMQWFNDTIGDAELVTTWNSNIGLIDVSGNVTRGGLKNIEVNGKYIFKEDDDLLDFDIALKKTYVQTFASYLEGIFSNLNGVVSADLRLEGTAKNPLLTGKAKLQKVSLMVDYLKTTYNFSTDVDLTKNSIIFDNVRLNDEDGSPAFLTGEIRHNFLRDFYFDLDFKLKKNKVLNTSLNDNDLFYGTAYASGKVKIKGFTDYIVMDMGLKSEKGTKISIPLSNPEEVQQSTFISFINKASESKADTLLLSPSFSGIALNMDFEVTSDANVYLIFDSKIGDVIEGTGKGNLAMSVSPAEDFKMYGNYVIEQGKYLFTMQNVINKSFVIEPGGNVRWNGDPYDAIVDIQAVYRTKAGLYDLLRDSTYKSLVPVDLRLQLKDKLFNPAIGFDIKISNVDPTISDQIERLINSEDERYRQAVSLLVTRKFAPVQDFGGVSTASSSGSVIGANAYELLSNQLSNWASQISSQVNVGVNYRPGDQLTNEELDIILSTSILNDRVTIDVNGGYSNTTNNNNPNTSNIVGDFNLEVKASKDGRVRFKVFNRSNNNTLINNINSPYTQGVGVFYREEFNSFNDLRRKYRELFTRKRVKTVN